MRLAPPQSRAYTYKVTVPPDTGPVSLDLFKQHISVTHNLTDEILQVYLDAAVQFAEKYTGRDLITRTYEGKRDFFPRPAQHEGYYTYGQVPNGSSNVIESFNSNVGFEIRKSPLRSVESITYVNNSNVLQTVDSSIYYNTTEAGYSEVLSLDGKDWPEDSNNKLQNITITFITGIGDTDADIPACWKVAIMNHAAMLWANRGDCSDSGCMKMVPASSKAFYEQKRIRNL